MASLGQQDRKVAPKRHLLPSLDSRTGGQEGGAKAPPSAFMLALLAPAQPTTPATPGQPPHTLQGTTSMARPQGDRGSPSSGKTSVLQPLWIVCLKITSYKYKLQVVLQSLKQKQKNSK